MKVRVIEKDLLHLATSAIPPIGTIGEVIEDTFCPAEKLAVQFDPVDLGYEFEEDADPLVLYMQRSCVEEIP